MACPSNAPQTLGETGGNFQPCRVDAGHEAVLVQGSHNGFGGDIAPGPRCKRTAAQPGHGSVKRAQAAVQRHRDIGQRPPFGVVEMPGKPRCGNLGHNGVQQAVVSGVAGPMVSPSETA